MFGYLVVSFCDFGRDLVSLGEHIVSFYWSCKIYETFNVVLLNFSDVQEVFSESKW